MIFTHRGLTQQLIPRNHSRLYAKMQMLPRSEGLKYWNDKDIAELTTSEVRGPEVLPGDMVIVMDYIKRESFFSLIKYYEIKVLEE